MTKLSTQKIALFILIPFMITSMAGSSISFAGQGFFLPSAGSMIGMSSSVPTPIIRGLKVNTKNPFDLDFIVDQGTSPLSRQELNTQAQRMVKYFLTILTIPQGDLWVNLSPYEKDRISTNELGETVAGRDMLAQDYLLKQLTASLTAPQTGLGKRFWGQVYKQAQETFGNTQIKVNTFNKVWIVPDKATVYQKGNTVFIVNSHLRVMMEEDYLSLQKHNSPPQVGGVRGGGNIINNPLPSLPHKGEGTHALASQVIKQIILPQIEKEINQGQNFAELRQIYNAFILALWYKRTLKASILNDVYINKKKTAGVDVDDKTIKEKIYKQYLQAYKKGVYNLIKEELDPATQSMVARKYFSGGLDLTEANWSMVSPTERIPEELANHAFADVDTHLENQLPANAAMTAAEYKKGLMAVVGLIQQKNIQEAALALRTGLVEFYNSNNLVVGELTDKDSLEDTLKNVERFESDQLDEFVTKIVEYTVTENDIEARKILLVTRLALEILYAYKVIEAKSAEKQYHQNKAVKSDLEDEIEGLKRQKDEQMVNNENQRIEIEKKTQNIIASKSRLSQILIEKMATAFAAAEAQVKKLSELLAEDGEKVKQIDAEIARKTTELQAEKQRLQEMNSEANAKITLLDQEIQEKQSFISAKVNEINKIQGLMGIEVPISAAPVINQEPAVAQALEIKEISVPLDVNTLPTLARFLRTRRKLDLNMSWEQYIEETGINYSILETYSRQNGPKLPAKEHIEIIAKVLKINHKSLDDRIEKIRQQEEARRIELKNQLANKAATPDLIFIPGYIKTIPNLKKFLARRRDELKLSNADLARITGISRISINFYLNPDYDRLPNTDEDDRIERLADALKIGRTSLINKIKMLEKLDKNKTKEDVIPQSKEKLQPKVPATSIEPKPIKELKKPEIPFQTPNELEPSREPLVHVEEPAEQEISGPDTNDEKIPAELLEITKEDILELISSNQQDHLNNSVSDEDFYKLLVKDIQELTTGIDQNIIEKYLNHVMEINWTTDEGKNKLRSYRDQANTQLLLRDLNDNQVIEEILRAKKGDTKDDKLGQQVIKRIAETYKVNISNVSAFLERLGYNNNRDYVLKYKYELLRREINKSLTLFGFRPMNIDTVDELKMLITENIFNRAIGDEKDAVDNILNRAKSTIDNSRKLSLIIYFLIAKNQKGIRELFGYIYPDFLKEMLSKKSTAVTELSRDKITYLDNLVALFGLEKLLSLGFPIKTFSIGDIHRFYKDLKTRATKNQTNAYNTLYYSAPIRNTSVNETEWKFYLEHPKDSAMQSAIEEEEYKKELRDVLDLMTAGKMQEAASKLAKAIKEFFNNEQMTVELLSLFSVTISKTGITMAVHEKKQEVMKKAREATITIRDVDDLNILILTEIAVQIFEFYYIMEKSQRMPHDESSVESIQTKINDIIKEMQFRLKLTTTAPARVVYIPTVFTETPPKIDAPPMDVVKPAQTDVADVLKGINEEYVQTAISLVIDEHGTIPDIQNNVINFILDDLKINEVNKPELIKHLGDLGYKSNRDFVVKAEKIQPPEQANAPTPAVPTFVLRQENSAEAERIELSYRQLQGLLNALLANMSGNYVITSTGQLKNLCGTKAFRETIKEKPTLETLHQAVSKQKNYDNKLSLYILFLIVRNPAIKALFVTIYPDYAHDLGLPSMARNDDRLSREVRTYLYCLWTIYGSRGRSELLKRDITRKYTAHDIGVVYDDYNRKKGKREKSKEFTALIHSHDRLLHTEVSQEDWEYFKQNPYPPKDWSMDVSRRNPGGINLDENFLNMQTKGDAMPLLNLERTQIANFSTNGFLPVIVRVTPITNIYHFLGVNLN